MARLSEKFQRHGAGEAAHTFDPFEQEKAVYAEIPLAYIRPDINQPRKDLGNLEDLQSSIAAHGIVQPLVVSVLAYNQYMLVTGERRYTAAKALGLATVPVIVRTLEDHARLEVQLIENLHRKDLNALEEARSYRRLIDEFGLTQEELGKRLGKSQPAINLTLKLLELPAQVQADYLTSNNGTPLRQPVSKSVLQEIAKQSTPDAQQALWERAKRGELTVKKARQVKQAATGQPVVSAPKSMSFRYPIQTAAALVTVSFDQSSATTEEIIAALEEALEGERVRLGSSSV